MRAQRGVSAQGRRLGVEQMLQAGACGIPNHATGVEKAVERRLREEIGRRQKSSARQDRKIDDRLAKCNAHPSLLVSAGAEDAVG